MDCPTLDASYTEVDTGNEIETVVESGQFNSWDLEQIFFRSV